MSITHNMQQFVISGFDVGIGRNRDGVLEIRAEDDFGLAAALGWAHAEDRLVQMMLTRLVAQGRLSECLQADETTLGIDIFMRQLGLAHDAAQDVSNLDPDTLRFAESYAAGVNQWLDRNRRPLELILVGYRPEPWAPQDCLVLIKLMSYVGLAQSQQDMEKLIIQAINGGAPPEGLRRLLAPHLDGMDDGIVGLINDLSYIEGLVPPEVRFSPLIPKIMASNNWAVAGSRTASGYPIQCNDPHLEVNRLPAIWYEAVMKTGGDYRIGITMPGLPGLVMGRTKSLSFGFTYGFMDTIDYFFEEVRDGAVRRGQVFEPLEVRREKIVRKKGDPLEILVYSSDAGVLETPPGTPEIDDGLYLARAWSAQHDGASPSMQSLREILNVGTVAEAQSVARHVSISCNWLFADSAGSIGYQQSGVLPDRGHSGLFPVPAWDRDNAWRGVIDPSRLHSILDPEEGFLVTANDDLNPPAGPLVINLPMGPYRAERLRDLLRDSTSLTIDDMQSFQTDLYSIQAETFMDLIRPFLPESPAGRLLHDWDCRYDVGSQAATLFERIYHRLHERVFSRTVFGDEGWKTIMSSTAVFADYFGFFDRALLREDESWFEPDGRDAVLREVVLEVVDGADPQNIPPWGACQRITMENIFFGGRLPTWVGFDYGPVELPGNRATIVQGGVFTSHERVTTFCPSYRFVTDLGRDEVFSILPGGPSGRRFSKYYTSEIESWLAGRYKKLGPMDP